uniref:Protein kinase domain-containing protein n=2 Tax=Scophthalmus maximus TaxID=52904 RepID=A0A8D3C7S2_SCOMX
MMSRLLLMWRICHLVVLIVRSEQTVGEEKKKKRRRPNVCFSEMSSNSHSSFCSTAEETDEDEETTSEPFKVQPFDTLLSSTSRYLIMEFTGEGSFGQVARALNLIISQEVALKILKTESESEREIRMLEALSVLDPVKHSVVHFCEKFHDRGHTCLVFEKLDMDLLGLFKQQQWEPLTPNEIRPITHQLLTALVALKSLGVVHADLKPDNIMLVNHLTEPYRVKLIDFGLSFMVSEEDTFGKTIQPQGYRAPEVSLGLPVSQAIDVWGLGCVLLFLYLVQHPFSTTCEYQEMKGIVDMLGQPADDLLHAGYFTQRFFRENQFWHDPEWWMKTPVEYQRTTGLEPEESTSPVRLLDDLLTLYPWMQGSTELGDTRAFVSLLKCLLHTDSEMRISPERALTHPFLTMVHLSHQTDGLYFKDTVDKMRIVGLDDSYDYLYSDEEDFIDISVTPRSTDTGSEVEDESGHERHPDSETEEESGDEENSATPGSTDTGSEVEDEEEESATPNTTAASDDFCSATGELTVSRHVADESEQTLSPVAVKKNRLRRIREFFYRVKSAILKKFKGKESV